MSLAYSRKLSNRQLMLLLKGLEGQFGQAILESVVKMKFVSVGRPPDVFHFDDAFDLSKWERGRAFGGETELRWRRRSDDFLSLLICESPLSLTPEVESVLGALNPWILERDDPGDRPMQVCLWGEWQDPVREPDVRGMGHRWYEERIPRFLAYPFSENEKHLAITVARYRVRNEIQEDDTERNFVYRFIQLEAMPVAEDA